MARALAGMSGAGKTTLLDEWAPSRIRAALLRRGATWELDGRLPVAVLADAVESLLTGDGSSLR